MGEVIGLLKGYNSGERIEHISKGDYHIVKQFDVEYFDQGRGLLSEPLNNKNLNFN